MSFPPWVSCGLIWQNQISCLPSLSPLPQTPKLSAKFEFSYHLDQKPEGKTCQMRNFDWWHLYVRLVYIYHSSLANTFECIILIGLRWCQMCLMTAKREQTVVVLNTASALCEPSNEHKHVLALMSADAYEDAYVFILRTQMNVLTADSHLQRKTEKTALSLWWANVIKAFRDLNVIQTHHGSVVVTGGLPNHENLYTSNRLSVWLEFGYLGISNSIYILITAWWLWKQYLKMTFVCLQTSKEHQKIVKISVRGSPGCLWLDGLKSHAYVNIP